MAGNTVSIWKKMLQILNRCSGSKLVSCAIYKLWALLKLEVHLDMHTHKPGTHKPGSSTVLQ